MAVSSPQPSSKRDATDATRKRVAKKSRGYATEQWVIGLFGTVLAHVLILLLLGQGFLKVSRNGTAEDPYKDFSIQLAEVEPEEEVDQVYTQTNPDVPENEPDDTNRFGARSQQAANEEKPDEIDPENRPATESDDTIETDQFLSGSLEEPVFAPPPTAMKESEEEAEQPPEAAPNQPMLVAVSPSEEAQRREIPISGEVDEKELEEEGIAETINEPTEEAPTNIVELIEGQEQEGAEEASSRASPNVAASVSPPIVDPNQAVAGEAAPRARPQLPRLPSAPVRDSRLGVSSLGQVAVDAKASKFGEYMERLIETVSYNWEELVQGSSTPERKSLVKIRFMLNRDGMVRDIEILDGTTSRAIGIYMCREAIERGVPYGPWPPGLVDMFGDEEDVTFTFHYN